MPQLLALEWNADEIRVAVASGRGRQVVIEQAFSIPRGEPDQPADRIGALIAAELDARNLGRPETLVAVGRTRVELRLIQVPPAPDDDLPDLVRFQASREFNELDDQWRLDFMPIESIADGPRNVLATAISPAMINEIEKVCEHAGLMLRRVVLRPCETAALLASRGAAAQSLQLLVELFAGEADLTALSGGKVVFLRTTRFAGDPPPILALLSEIRLTTAAARNQLGGEKIESLILCGQEALHSELAKRVEAELGMRVTLFDPFTSIETSPELKSAMPAHPGRFAPLLGTLQVEQRGSGHSIDFLHPRRRPDPPSRRRLYIAAGAAVGVLLLSYFIYSRVAHYLLASEVDALISQSRELDDLLKKGNKTHLSTADIAKWTDQDTIWLDKLYALSQSFPPSTDAVLGGLTLSAGPRGSQMDLKGFARKAETIASMEKSINESAGKINDKGSREDASVKPYSWRFEASVLLERDPDKPTVKTSAKTRPTAPAKGAKQ